jgi:hypothetical protein
MLSMFVGLRAVPLRDMDIDQKIKTTNPIARKSLCAGVGALTISNNQSGIQS